MEEKKKYSVRKHRGDAALYTVTDPWGKTLLIEDVERSRNGVTGEGFYTVVFTDPDVFGSDSPEVRNERFIAMVFGDEDPDGPFYNCTTGVVSLSMLNEKGLKHNTWRGDHYDKALRHAIERWQRDKSKAAGWYERGDKVFAGVNSNRQKPSPTCGNCGRDGLEPCKFCGHLA